MHVPLARLAVQLATGAMPGESCCLHPCERGHVQQGALVRVAVAVATLMATFMAAVVAAVVAAAGLSAVGMPVLLVVVVAAMAMPVPTGLRTRKDKSIKKKSMKNN